MDRVHQRMFTTIQRYRNDCYALLMQAHFDILHVELTHKDRQTSTQANSLWSHTVCQSFMAPSDFLPLILAVSVCLSVCLSLSLWLYTI